MAKIKSFGALGNLLGVKPPKEPPQQKKSQPQRNSQRPQNSPQPATAPYNFVSLPEKILPAPFELNNFSEYISASGNLSGEIILAIETLTPLFIGGCGTKSFAPVSTPIIPGSSLRGMFKNLCKIVTCGAFRGRTKSQKKGEDFNDEHIYFRCLMGVGRYPWTKDLNKLYNGRMVRPSRGKDGKTRLVKNARPGFLIRTTDNKFFIAPSIYTSDRKEDRILIRDYEKKFRVRIPERNSSCVKWDGGIAYIITGSQRGDMLYDAKTYERLGGEQKKRAGKQFIRFTKLDYLDWCREHWVALPDDVQTSYEHDRNRRGVNLFKVDGFLRREEVERLTGKNLPDVKTLIPCHYLEEDGQVTAFGHGQCFRIPYKKRIGDAVPKNLQSEEIVDFAYALFGREKFWSSRVYFEDAKPSGEVSTLPQAATHPLMQPNPTSYQLYLKQNSSGALTNWDTLNAQVRGYKLYWHKSAADWHANKSELALDAGKTPDKRLTKEMTPLETGSRFTAKIRFKNLSAVELGALMMIFDLNGLRTAAYKIGQGKPFGFGSVKISPTLFVEDDSAYTELFGADGWQSPYRKKNPAEYLDEFKTYLERCNLFEAWQAVMDELTKILDWSSTQKPGWSEKVRSMSGDVSQSDGVDERFKQRVPLPTIFEVVR